MEIKVFIDGINCGGCATGFENRLYQYGVSHFDIDFATRIATITYDEKDLDANAIIAIIESFGYQVTLLP
jgi:copper chaperone CopZ